jgi:hypothetical protein
VFARYEQGLFIYSSWRFVFQGLNKQRFYTVLDSSFVFYEHRFCAAVPVADVSQWTPSYLDPVEFDRPYWRPSGPSEGSYLNVDRDM